MDQQTARAMRATTRGRFRLGRRRMRSHVLGCVAAAVGVMLARPFTARLVATTAVASLLALAAPAGAPAACSIAPASWVGGTTNLCHGTVVYNDYVYDDYGADTGAIATTSNSAGLAPTSGDQSYPSGLMNTA